MNERQSVQRFLRGAALLLCLGVSAQAVTSYRVQPGDTLGGIAARAGVSAAQIRAVNARLRGTDQVQAGWVLTLPDRTLPARTHTVKNGENLSVIAARYGLSLGALLNANPAYRNGKAVWTGARLNIPARTSSSASAAAAPAARSTATVRTASSSGRSGGWLWPVSGHHGVSSGYGPRVLGGVREDHWGWISSRRSAPRSAPPVRAACWNPARTSTGAGAGRSCWNTRTAGSPATRT
ncbi:LysM peptidoglycan-binding domain-containing protein [Deinococcus aquaticus]|uniref:LysM peptidoglycan-binding domain-containing protein n=1 Tax=Deinococcus aquaticus TaxID=328692 RepID=UPI00361747A6